VSSLSSLLSELLLLLLLGEGERLALRFLRLPCQLWRS
jgi:hypothetical protein